MPRKDATPDQLRQHLLDNSAINEHGCMIWTGCANGNGYGRLFVGGKLVYPHRLSFNLFVGPIPIGMHVCHSCDVRVCIAPGHLWLGTDADNLRDMRKKGRGSPPPIFKGVNNHSAKLTADNVIEIRSRYEAGGTSYLRLANEFGVTKGSIGPIIRRETWADI